MFKLIVISTRERLKLCPQFFSIGGPVYLPWICVVPRFCAATIDFENYVVLIRGRELIQDSPVRDHTLHVSRSHGQSMTFLFAFRKVGLQPLFRKSRLVVERNCKSFSPCWSCPSCPTPDNVR